MEQHLWLDLLYVALAVAILWKCADWFVDGAVAIAERLQVPQMLVGLVIVSIATTSPELMASLLAALRGMPEVALGNAVGSVIIDASVALGLAAVISVVPLTADRSIFRTSALMLMIVLPLSFLMCLDGVLARYEGIVLLILYVTYAAVSYVQVRRRQRAGDLTALPAEVPDLEHLPAHKIVWLFLGGLIGVIGGSHLLLEGAVGLAVWAQLPTVVIGLTVVAIGTSMPEVATCVASAVKKQGGIGIGNILGADILNICWVAGLSSIANPLVAERRVVLIMFPAVLVIVAVMLAMLRCGYRLSRLNGAILLVLYVLYVCTLLYFAPRDVVITAH